MDSRRDFLKKALLMAAGGGVAGGLPGSIQKAFAIDPPAGSTFLDAEHIVILMQENRSFDHTYGSLRGVRGFNDPRAVPLPNGNPVWLQTNAAGETYAPFRLNIRDTNATWLGSLPHSWVDQAAARNEGKHDGWLDAKVSHHQGLPYAPLTLGFYNRDDLPFYYALADAFTICDQNFCSSLTATEPNRLHLWSGTVRPKPTGESFAYVRNEDMGYDQELGWTTFPERLEDLGISWKIYQNEISLPSGLEKKHNIWLSNFDDNPLEYFTQYRVRFATGRRRHLAELEKSLAARLTDLEARKVSADEITTVRAKLEETRRELAVWSDAEFAKLSVHDRNVHGKAFSTNEGDPDYRELTELNYKDGGIERTMQIPKGDILHQFREDVRAGKLPAVSWLVPPEAFSDHPSSAWYGAWYLSETFDILTQNPEVWKKTIFILCYDENDGYFDHVPPFVAPAPNRPETGKVSKGIDPSVEHVSQTQMDAIRRQEPRWKGKPGPIGLGFRVPLVIASPWSRGGYVCSEVFDHTSIVRLLETVLSHKQGKPVTEPNISAWRRTVCGDMASVFRPYGGERIDLPTPIPRDPFLESIHDAQFKRFPDGFKKLAADEIAEARANPNSSPHLPRQEKGIRPACALPYELGVDGALRADRKVFVVNFSARTELFGRRASGAPFRVVALKHPRIGSHRDYAVAAGDTLADFWPLADFEGDAYHLQVHGPNGFFREFQGTVDDPKLEISCRPEVIGGKATGDLEMNFVNHNSPQVLGVTVAELAYDKVQQKVSVGGATGITVKLARSHGWYDLRIRVESASSFEQRYAGRIETGRESFSDPQMGGE